MKKVLLLLSFIFPVVLNAQEYNKSAGFRGGESWGFTLRLCSDEANAAEAMLGFRDGGMQFTVLKETIMPVLLKYSEHIFLCKGYGGHLGYSQWHHRNYFDLSDKNWHRLKTSPLIGIDGYLELEYRLFKIPLSAGIDFRPFAELGGRRFFRINLWDFGCTIRYTFNK